MCGIYLAGMPIAFQIAQADDAPGLIILAMLLAAAPVVIAVFAAILQKLTQHALDIQSENELTV